MYDLRHSIDFLPKLKPAGVETKYLGDSTAKCIQPLELAPVTPDTLKRFRQSYKHQTGKTVTHYGKVNDPEPPKIIFGKKLPESDHVKNIFKTEAHADVKDFIHNLKEAQYPSQQRAPLGRSVDRSYKWPEEIQTYKNHSFGVPIVQSESAKGVIYDHPGIHDDERIRQLYIKSHSQWEAGEQIKRGYKWPVSPIKHVFGLNGNKIVGEAKMCLQPEIAGDIYPKTVFQKKNAEDFRDFAYNSLGSSKNFGQTNSYVGPNHTYGFKRKAEPVDAGQCIYGGSSIYKHVKPDDNVGRSTNFGTRNIPHEGDEKRVFGIPTVRSDIIKPVLPSVASPYNYGDEPRAVELLSPQRFHSMGVDKKDFEVMRSKEELRRLFANIGYGYKPGKFEGIFERARELSNARYEEASVNAFIEAVKEMGDRE